MFDPHALDAPLEPLDRLPRNLWLQGLVNSLGRIAPRLAALEVLRAALVAGRLPAPEHAAWPLPPAAAPFREVIERLGLPGYARDQEDVAIQIVATLLWHTDRIIDLLDHFTPDEAARHAADAFAEEWRESTADLDEILAMFGDLGEALEFADWTLTRGLLKTEGWKEMLRIRQVLEKLPELRALLRRLGRAFPGPDTDPAHLPLTEAVEQVRVPIRREREARFPEVPAETRGVTRSGRIARMLPCESVLLRHPRLRLTWFARHAERTLLTYEEDDRIREPAVVEVDAWRRAELPRPAPRLEMGPMVLCVDTSASMQGAPERVAKAAVLEAMRTCAAQKRRCYVYAFSGPEEIVERELPLSARGIAAAIDFMAQGFHGGTEVDGPLRRALDRVHAEEWKFADLVMVSDGHFGAGREVIESIGRARDELGLRVQGILIEDRESSGMNETCGQVLRIAGWREMGRSESVTGDRDLTALYFPGVGLEPGESAVPPERKYAYRWMPGQS